MTTQRHVASVLRLARQAAKTKAVLRKWEERPYADTATREDRAFAEVAECIDALDSAIADALRFANKTEVAS